MYNEPELDYPDYFDDDWSNAEQQAQDETEAWDYSICPHGIYEGLVGGYCKECDIEEEKHGGIDRCMQCGKYVWSDSLTYPDQVCKKGCRNPNEY
jgi:hypothetical protein